MHIRLLQDSILKHLWIARVEVSAKLINPCLVLFIWWVVLLLEVPVRVLLAHCRLKSTVLHLVLGHHDVCSYLFCVLPLEGSFSDGCLLYLCIQKVFKFVLLVGHTSHGAGWEEEGSSDRFWSDEVAVLVFLHVGEDIKEVIFELVREHLFVLVWSFFYSIGSERESAFYFFRMILQKPVVCSGHEFSHGLLLNLVILQSQSLHKILLISKWCGLTPKLRQQCPARTSCRCLSLPLLCFSWPGTKIYPDFWTSLTSCPSFPVSCPSRWELPSATCFSAWLRSVLPDQRPRIPRGIRRLGSLWTLARPSSRWLSHGGTAVVIWEVLISFCADLYV